MNPPTIRPPAVAGTFYTDRPDKLAAAVENMLDQAQDAGLEPVRALIAPHAGYRYSGLVAASAFRQLRGGANGQRRTVYLLGPAHYVYVDSIALSPAEAFETPLGRVQQNRAAVDALLARGRRYELHPLAHEPEHSLEVELPFLQTVLHDFDLVAMLCGQPDVDGVAADLAGLLEPSDLVVVSSDLSHFYPYDSARALDRAMLEAVVAGDAAAAAQGEACGLQPILILMRLAQALNWTPHLLDYRNSGDTGGDKSRVVGYGAVAYVAGGAAIPQRMKNCE